MAYVFGIAFSLRLIFRCLTQPLLGADKYFDFTSYFQRAECLLSYQEDFDIYSVLINDWQIVDRGSVVCIATTLRNRQSRVPVPGKARFSAPVQTDPEPSQMLVQWVPGIPRLKRPGRGVDHLPSSRAEVKD